MQSLVHLACEFAKLGDTQFLALGLKQMKNVQHIYFGLTRALGKNEKFWPILPTLGPFLLFDFLGKTKSILRPYFRFRTGGLTSIFSQAYRLFGARRLGFRNMLSKAAELLTWWRRNWRIEGRRDLGWSARDLLAQAD